MRGPCAFHARYTRPRSMAHDGEKRRDPRVPLVLRVEYPGAPDAMRDVTEDLSAGGIFIRTTRELPLGARLPLHISFPGLLAPVEVEVEVVRGRPVHPDRPRARGRRAAIRAASR